MLLFFPRLPKLYGKITLEHTRLRTYTKKERDVGVEVAKDHGFYVKLVHCKNYMYIVVAIIRNWFTPNNCLLA